MKIFKQIYLLIGTCQNIKIPQMTTAYLKQDIVLCLILLLFLHITIFKLVNHIPIVKHNKFIVYQLDKLDRTTWRNDKPQEGHSLSLKCTIVSLDK